MLTKEYIYNQLHSIFTGEAGQLAEYEWADLLLQLNADVIGGANARTVDLVSPSLMFIYNEAGSQPQPTSEILTATAIGTEFTPWYEFLVDGEPKQNSTSNTYEYFPPTSFVSMPQVITVKLREGNNSGAVVAQKQLLLQGLQRQSGSITTLISNTASVLPTTSPGGFVTYIGSGTEIRVWEGATELAVDNEGPTYDGRSFRIGTPIENNITCGDIIQNYGDYSVIVDDHDVMTATTASITYPIIVTNSAGQETTYNRMQVFSKAIQGAQGAEGSPGLNGVSPITALVSNEVCLLASDVSGNVSSYTGSGTLIQVYAGSTQLQFTTGTATTGQFSCGTPTQNPTNTIIIGGNSVSGLNCVVADHDVMDGGTDAVTISYPLTLVHPNGSTLTTTVVQRIAKAKQGYASQYVSVTGAQVFRYAHTGATVPSPTSITLTATLYGGLTEYEWQYYDGSLWQLFNESTQDYVLTYNHGAWSTNVLRVRCVSGAYNDEITITKLYDGTSNITPVLSNEVHSFPASSVGAVSSYVGSGTEIHVYQGVTELDYDSASTANGKWKINSTTPVNITVGTPVAVGGISPNRYAVVPQHTGVANGTHASSIVYNITGKDSFGSNFSFNKTQTFSKAMAGADGLDGIDGIDGSAGVNARSVTLAPKLGSVSAFVYNTNGQAGLPISSTLEATVLNAVGDLYYAFSLNDEDYSTPTLNNEYSYAPNGLLSSMPEKVKVEVREGADDNPVIARDQIMMIGLRSGQSAITVSLSNEAHTIPTDSAGTPASGNYTGSGTTIQVWEGATAVPIDTSPTYASPSFRVAAPVGANITPGSVTQTDNGSTFIYKCGTPTETLHSNMNADTATITYAVTIRNSAGVETVQTVIQSFSKSKQGVDSTSYWLTPSASAIQRTITDVFTPSTLTVSAYSKTGTAVAVAYSGWWNTYESTNGSDEGSPTPVAQGSFATRNPTVNTQWLRFKLYADSLRTILLDQETIPVVHDGATGNPGQNATSYWLITDVASLSKSQAGVYTPASLVISAKTQVGSAAPAAYAGRITVAELSSTSVWGTETSKGDVSSTTHTPSANIKAVRVRLYVAGAQSNLLDEEVVPVVTDGINSLGSVPISFAPGTIGGSGDFVFTINALANGTADAGEVRVQGSRFLHPDGTVRAMQSQSVVYTNLEGAGTISGTYYLMWTDTDVVTRFGGTYLSTWGDCTNIVPIKVDGSTWKVVDNSGGTTYTLTIASTDCILAVIDKQLASAGLSSIVPLVGSLPGVGSTESWTPVITNGGTARITVPRPGSFTKVGGTGSWDTAVHSVEGYNACVLSFRAGRTDKAIMIGLDDAPAANASYSVLAFAWYIQTNATCNIYENNVSLPSQGAYTAATVFSIIYDGKNVMYYKDSVLVREVAYSGILYLDSSFNTVGGEITNLKYTPIPADFTPHGRSLITQETWVVGSSGSQPGFTMNGATAENVISLGEGPLGDNVTLWGCINDATSDADGGWNTSSFVINSKKKYRFVVFYKRNLADGSTYLGCGTSTVRNLSDGVVNGNPYFWSGSPPVYDRWYMIVGYVHSEVHTGTTHEGAVYDCLTGEKVVTCTDYKWVVNQSTSLHRAYLYYATNTSTRQYFWNPRVELCDGAEVPLTQLLPVLAGAQLNTGFIAPGGHIVIENDVVTGGVKLRKNRATALWDSECYSSQGYTKCTLTFRASQTTAAIMVGLNTDPLTNADWSSLDYAFYLYSNGNHDIRESNSTITFAGTYTTNTVFQITYDGANVRYLKNGTVVRSQSIAGRVFYFDTSFNTNTGAITDVSFVPSTLAWRPTWQNIAGIPSPALNIRNDDSPTVAGLYLGPTKMGYHNASTWRTYMEDTGNFYLKGASTTALSWESGVLTVTGRLVVDPGDAGSSAFPAAAITGTLTASQIAAGAITASKLSVLAGSVVNNPVISGNINGWGNILEDGSGTSTVASYHSTERVLRITSSASHSVRCISFPVGPDDMYLVKGRVKKTLYTDSWIYVGVSAFAVPTAGAEGTITGAGTQTVIPIPEATRVEGTAITDYSPVSHEGTTSWLEFSFYILGTQRLATSFPTSTHGGVKMTNATHHMAIRFLNWSNSVSNSMDCQVTVQNVDHGILKANQIDVANLFAQNTAISGSLTVGNPTTTTSGMIAGTGTNVVLWAGSTTANRATSSLFRVTAGGALTATSATITGAITATSGTFGLATATSKWTVGGVASGNSYIAIGKTTLDSTVAGVYLGTNGISMGGAGIAPPFSVTAAGALTATSATITGAITATSGYIGDSTNGWTINSNRFFSAISNPSASQISMSKVDGPYDGNTSYYYYNSTTNWLKGLMMTWHQSNNAGHIVFGQMASNGYTKRASHFGIQMMNWTGTEYFALGSDTSKTVSDETRYYCKIAGFDFNSTMLSATNLKIISGASARVEVGTGVGVQKRATRLADEKIDWVDTPDTSPASPEVLRARIGRLGVGGGVLLNGEFNSPISGTFGTVKPLNDAGGASPYVMTACVERENVEQVIFSIAFSFAMYPGVYSRNVNSGASTKITTHGATAVSATKRFNGNRVLAYYSGGAIYTSLFTTSWATPASRFSLASITHLTLIETPGGVLELYMGTASSVSVSTSTNGTTWTTPTTVTSTANGKVSYIYDASAGTERLLMRSSTTAIMTRTRTVGGSWGAESLYFTFSTAVYNFVAVLDISGKIHAIHEDSGTSGILYDSVISGETVNKTAIGSLANYGSGVHAEMSSSDGKMAVLMWVPNDSEALGYMSKPTYAQLGAGIIETGRNTDGSYIKFSDGTMQCWHTRALTHGTTYTFPVPFVSPPSFTLLGHAGAYPYTNVSPTATSYIPLWSGLGTGAGSFIAIGRWK